MQQIIRSAALSLFFPLSIMACSKNDPGDNDSAKASKVTGKITDNSGHAIPDVKVTIEHTVWFNNYVLGTTNSNGQYTVGIPANPAGSWTAKAQLERAAYGQIYKFDLLPDNNNPFDDKAATVRNFTWKLIGQRPGNTGFYGAHVDLYVFGADVQPGNVKLVFTPIENTLIDGSPAVSFERNIEDVAGTFMAKDIPIGRYKVKAVATGRSLLLDNRHDNGDPEIEKEVVFGKNGMLGETEYNIEFWLSE